MNVCNRCHKALWICQNGLFASVIHYTTGLHTKRHLSKWLLSQTQTCYLVSGRMIKRPAASFIRTVALCSPPCLLSVRGRGRDESSSEGAEREKPCKSGRIQAAMSSCISVNHPKIFKRPEEKTDCLSDRGTRVLWYFSDFFSQRDDAETTELFSHLTEKQHT